MEYTFRTLSLSDMLEEARKKDPLFIAKYARSKPDGTALRKFNIIHHEDSEHFGKKFRFVHNEEKEPPR
jgi:hypothetical protein